MPFESKRAKICLSNEEYEQLTTIANSRTEAKSKVERAKIILYYSRNKKINNISKMLNTNRPKIERCIDKALNLGVMNSLKDLQRSGRKPQITDEAKLWMQTV